jgi:O-antigen/teichoic acid export membrane protein
MASTLLQLTRHSAVYGMGAIMARVLGFILLPIYTRHLTPADYGVYSLLVVTGAVAAIVMQMGMGSALFREVIFVGSDRRTAISTGLAFLAAESAALLIALLVIAPSLSSAMLGDAAGAGLLALVFTAAAFDVVGIVAMAKLRIETRSTLYATVTLARFLTSAVLNILFVAVLELGVRGLVTANAIVAGVFAVVWLALLLPDMRPSFSRAVLHRLLAFGVPLVPFGLARLSMTSADRYFLNHYSTAAEVGLYSIGYQFGMATALVVTAVQLAWAPQMFAIAKRDDAESQLARMLTYYVLVLGFLGLAVSVLAREALIVMTTPSFYGGAVVVPFIALSYILYGVMFMTNSGLETRNLTRYMTPVILVSAGLNLVLNYMLIPEHGMMGAAWATLASYLFLVLVNTALNLRVWYIRYEYERLAKVMAAVALVFAAAAFVRLENVWLSVGAKLGLLALFPLVLLALRFFDERELAWLRRGWRQVRERLGSGLGRGGRGP